MNAIEFEDFITSKGFYVIRPSALNWTVDSDFTDDGDMQQVIANNQRDLSLCVRKRSEQVGKTSFYFREKSGDHYFKVVVGNETTTGGNSMGIKEYFDAHTDQRMLLKYAILSGASLGVVYLTYQLDNQLLSVEFVTLVPMVIAFLNEKIKPLDPNKPWMFIGANGEKKAKRKN